MANLPIVSTARAAVVAAVLAVAAPASMAQDVTGGPAAEFAARIDEYVMLHRQLEGTVPMLHVSRDPAEVRAAVTALGTKIRAARPDARQGDVFTPAVTTFFRRSIVSCLAGRSVAALLADLEAERYEEEGDQPGPMPVPKVNDTYPPTVEYPIMLPSLLAALPPLPEELQYRLVGRILILWDHHADLVVDVLPDALPPPET
jgi:hypothetical protein